MVNLLLANENDFLTIIMTGNEKSQIGGIA